MAPLSKKAPISQDSPLLDLPPEIRNNIYEMVFEGTIIKVDREDLPSTAPGLLRTCRQIYNEAVGMYHASATIYSRFYFRLYMWLKRRGNRQGVKNALLDHAPSYWRLMKAHLDIRLDRERREYWAKEGAADINRMRQCVPDLPIDLFKVSILAPNQEMVWTTNPLEDLRVLEEEWAGE